MCIAFLTQKKQKTQITKNLRKNMSLDLKRLTMEINRFMQKELQAFKLAKLN